MPEQGKLFDDDAYQPFENSLPDGYPKFQFKPTHPAFNRKLKVRANGKAIREYYVDLSIGECSCDGQPGGFAFARNTLGGKKEWYERAYCVHKLRAMSRICEETELVGDQKLILELGYLKALATRYNSFEAVSAFHKELRRGDVSASWFFGLILMEKRSLRGVFKYMLNIVYEETRDHELAAFLLKCSTSDRMITLSNAFKAISWFCTTKKKWEIPRRFSVFEAEMKGYRWLVLDYGRDVAKGANIIDKPAAKDKLLAHMVAGAKANNLVQFQRGLKGLQKLKYYDGEDRDGHRLQEHRFWIYEKLYELGEEMHGEHHDMWAVVSYVNQRIAAGLGIGYHELNAIADALTGETSQAGLLPPVTRQAALARPMLPIPLYDWRTIPLYAQDNHTYEGKRLMNRFPEQLKPMAKQTDLDFRYCGAYFGVAYRMISHNQHGKVEEWHNVRWHKDIYNIVMSLWY